MPDYFAPKGGLPPQTDLLTGRAVFTESYAVIPQGTMRDITTSALPHWDGTRLWVIARPMTGFAETFSHYVMEVQPGGGSDAPEPDAAAQGALFVTQGRARLAVEGAEHALEAGAYAYIPPGSAWTFRATGDGRRARPLSLDPQGLGGGARPRPARADHHLRRGLPAPADARHRWPLGHDPLPRSRRPAP